MTALNPWELANHLAELINNAILKTCQLHMKIGQLHDPEYQDGLLILIRRIELNLRQAKRDTETCIREIELRGNPKQAEEEKASSVDENSGIVWVVPDGWHADRREPHGSKAD